jgi:hypothetical protein
MDIKRIIQADKRYHESVKVLESAKSIEDPEEREKALDKASQLIAGIVYDKCEMYDIVAWQLINAADVLLRASADLIAVAEPKAKYKDKFNLGQAKQALNKIINTFETASVKINEDYLKHGYTEGTELNVFDAIDQNSRLVLCFILLCYNSINQNGNNAKQIEAYLKRAKGGKPLFSQEEIESFKGNF